MFDADLFMTSNTTYRETIDIGLDWYNEAAREQIQFSYTRTTNLLQFQLKMNNTF